MRARLLTAIAIVVFVAGEISSLRAQDAASAKALLNVVYQHYRNGAEDGSTGINWDGPDGSRYYHSSLLALMRADVKANGPDNVPAVDFDPVCGCQDWDGIFDLKIDVQVQSPGRTQANDLFALAPPKNRTRDDLRKLKFTLIPEQGAGRIYDIRDETDPKTITELRKLLEDDLASLRRSSAPKKSH